MKLSSAVAALVLLVPAHQPAAHAADQVTVPLIVEGNRPFVEVTFHLADGSTKAARFLVDSGGGGFLLTEPLAKSLGLKWGKTQMEDDQALAAVTSPVPSASIGDFPLPLIPQRVIVLVGADNVLPAKVGHAEGLLPGHVLARNHVVFDYPNGTFTIAQPGVLTPKGDVFPMPVSKPQGFPRTELTIDGTTYGFLLDTGASFTMVSEVRLKAWGSAHPDWPRWPGAHGDAALLGGTTLETMTVPEVKWAGRLLKDVGVTSQHEGTFEKMTSGMMTAPIVGSLAGNVLKNFRVELDYPNQKLYLSAK